MGAKVRVEAVTYNLVTAHDVTDPRPLHVDVPRARVLLRAYGCPLGFVAVDGPATLTSEELLELAGPPAQQALATARGRQQTGPWPGSGGLVSVIVATRDRPEPLRLALSSVLGCTGDFEVIVVDNAPTTDQTRDVVAALADPRVRYTRLDAPGLSRARNHGATLAKGAVLAFTDDDVRVDPGWVQALEGAFTLAPDTAIVTGMVAAAELTTPAQAYFDARVAWSTRCLPAEFRLTRDRKDPLLPYRGGEDLDLLARTLLSGWRIKYEPAALVWHTHRRDVDDLQHQMRGYGSGLTAYLAKQAATPRGARSLASGLVRGLRRVAAQQSDVPAAPSRSVLLRAERRGLLEGPWLYLKGRRSAPIRPGSPDAEPAVPVLELLSSDPVPDAGAPLLATVHGHPVGVLPLADPDPRQIGRDLFAAAVAEHTTETEPCGWQAELGTARPAATVVLTTTGDRPHGLAATVDRLLSQSYAPLEVVVVDNRPGTWDTTGIPQDRVRVVAETVPGISSARNAGLAATTTPVVLFTDDDVMPSLDWAGWLVAALHAAPEAACATGLILPLETRTRGQQLLEEWGGFSKGFTRQIHPQPQPSHPLYPYLPGCYGSGANVAFRTDELRALGGYDVVLGAGTPTYGGEDLAMQLAVVLSGRRLVYEPAAVMWHRHRASAADWGRQLFRYGTGLSASMLRHAVRSPQERTAMLRRVPAATRYALSPSSTKNAARSGDYPRAFVLLELLGMAYGPVALWRSSRRYRERS